MNKIIKYNLEIMSVIFAVVIAAGLLHWSELSLLRQMTIIFMILYTLHEWEESRFPGGFYKIFFSKCPVSPSASEERMHFPVAVYLLIILLLPYILGDVLVLALVPLVLALFEGVIHTAGIVIHQLKKPYSPGMITAWAMCAYSIFMITQLRSQTGISGLDWILGILLTIASFFAMETQFLKAASITIKEFQTSMRSYMLGRIKGKR